MRFFITILILGNVFLTSGNGHEFISVFKDGQGADGLNGASACFVSPDGNNVYVIGNYDDAIAIFSRDPLNGDLKFINCLKDGDNNIIDGLDGAWGGAISPDGKNVYVAGFVDSALAIFSRDTITGELTYMNVIKNGEGCEDGLDGALSCAVSPDGKNVYVTGGFDDAVVIFKRDVILDSLIYLSFVKDGVNGVDGLNMPYSVTVSPDGKNVYVAGEWDNAIAVFSRDTTTGILTYMTMYKDEIGGIDGLNAAISCIVSKDGRNVYVAGAGDNSVAIFSRDISLGTLTFISNVKNGLDVPYSVTINNKGTFVYATGMMSNTLAIYKRYKTTGNLEFDTAIEDGQGNIDGLEGASFCFASPEDKNVYVAGHYDDAIATFLNTDSNSIKNYKTHFPSTSLLSFTYNITNSLINIKVNIYQEGAFTLMLYDLKGCKIKHIFNGIAINKGLNIFKINKSDIANGIYLICFIQNNCKYLKKIIID